MEKKKIMVVEEDPVIRNLLQSRLKILGYDVSTKAGEEAVKSAEETKPDIVLMDFNVHEKTDGIATAREIKARSDSRIIFLLGISDQETIDRVKELPPDGFVLKPFTDTELRVAIELAK